MFGVHQFFLIQFRRLDLGAHLWERILRYPTCHGDDRTILAFLPRPLEPGTYTLQRLKPRNRDADHGITAGQPDTAGRLTPKCLDFDDLAELAVIWAIVP